MNRAPEDTFFGVFFCAWFGSGYPFKPVVLIPSTIYF